MISLVLIPFLFFFFFILPNVFFAISGAVDGEYGNTDRSRIARFVQKTPGYKIGFWLGENPDA